MASTSLSAIDGAWLARTAVILLTALLPRHSAVGQFSREDKQLMLDTHNYHRSSVNGADMKRIVSSYPRAYHN